MKMTLVLMKIMNGILLGLVGRIARDCVREASLAQVSDVCLCGSLQISGCVVDGLRVMVAH